MNLLQRALCSNMVSEWRFEPDGEGASRVTWEYAIHERGLVGRLLGPLVARQFQRAMQSCLDNVGRRGAGWLTARAVVVFDDRRGTKRRQPQEGEPVRDDRRRPRAAAVPLRRARRWRRWG
jgi:hypothetical protein